MPEYSKILLYSGKLNDMEKIFLKTKSGRMVRYGDLSDRERRIIQTRLGEVGGMRASRNEVCKKFDISLERLLQVEDKVKRVLDEAD